MKDKIDIQDLYLAVYLFMEGVPILEHSRRYGYSTFTFHQDQHTQALIDKFMTNDNPFMRFASALRQIKSLMYSDDSRNTFSDHITQHVKLSKGKLI
jgi:hypothetical protein